MGPFDVFVLFKEGCLILISTYIHARDIYMYTQQGNPVSCDLKVILGLCAASQMFEVQVLCAGDLSQSE